MELKDGGYVEFLKARADVAERRLYWWFTETPEREAQREEIRKCREQDENSWSLVRWFEEIDRAMEGR